ncbi:MAG: TonB-dependent receptor [Deltaproteobacteria bacterium]|nr:TonB-dependent receptor [Deltaproteobacteria bacterium]
MIPAAHPGTPLAARSGLALAIGSTLAMALLAPLGAMADEDEGAPRVPSFETTVRAPRGRGEAPKGRAASAVERADLERRLPRSAPDALRYEPGVFVQQTAHSQGSAFIRGLTGQQTLLLFDGIRVNNSTWRQGPNQYLFTLDSGSLDSIEVLRGGASTRYGSDALGGVILAHPVGAAPRGGGLFAHPALAFRGSSADGEYGGRLQLEVGGSERFGALVGFGGRSVGLLRSGGAVHNPANQAVPEVPRFAADGRTQLGTGFEELTGDARLSFRPADHQQVTLAAYLYRQYDAPRTDQCPPPGARWDECLTIDEQFRTLVYGAWSLKGGTAHAPDSDEPVFAPTTRVTLSWQQQHERRTGSRPASFVLSRGTDEVDTLGITGRTSRLLGELGPTSLRLLAGADTYFDLVRSRASIAFTDIDVEVERSRGQYLQGSRYLYGGAFLDGEVELAHRVRLTAGGRLSWIHASSPADALSGTSGVSQGWFPLVGHVGASFRPVGPLTLLLNLDHSFRAPNLDDLTSRQQTGPGFQFENPTLQPERATTAELGAQLQARWVTAEAWAFATLLTDAIGRRVRLASDCPPGTLQCQASWSRFQLVNASAASEVLGLEGSASVRLPAQLRGRVSVAWAWGEGPNLADPPSDRSLPWKERVPLSRIPPLNGTVELFRAVASGVGAGAALRWALAQDRLAVADQSDARIPLGGTPGFAVLDLRASYRVGHRFVVSATLENVFDSAYRYHGSSVNGPGRSVTLALSTAPFQDGG